MSTPPPSAPVSRTKTAFAIAAATVGGALVALQSRVNGQLGAEIHDGAVAAVISFGSGLVIVAIAVVVTRAGRAGLAQVFRGLRSREIPWWLVCGGAAGGLFVLAQGLTVGLIGVAVFTVATVAGQALSGLAIDARGIRHIAPKVITRTRVLGTVIALAAVVLSVGSDLNGRLSPIVLVAPFVVGCFLGWQQAVNGQVKTYSNSAAAATFMNFVAGTVLLLIVAIAYTAFAGWPHSLPANPTLYVGGLIGVVFIAAFSIITPIIGVLLQGLAAVAGQLIMSLILGFVAPAGAAGVAWTTVLGTVLTLVGVAVAAVPSRALIRRRAEPR